MSESTPDVATQPGDELLLQLADDYLRRCRAGEQPTVDEYVSKHPEFADRIRELFPAMIAMEQPGPGATADLAPPAERVGVTIGRYKLLERIGEGGFGVVYMAEQQHPVRRKVALKVVKPGMDSRQVLARFDAERQALAIMDHPNIAKVFDAGATDSGRPYFVMELVKGEPITEFCDRNQLPPRERLELFAQVCHAVQHAHQKGIIHRDIKPTNVLVAMHDTTPVVKVIDFGVAKALGQELTDMTLFTGFAQLLGTPLYMSPEQAGHSALDVDTRSDIYSLGVLLYELLTSTTPFDKERFRKAAHEEICRIIREEEPPKPSTRLSESKESLPSISAQRQTEPAKLTKLVRGELDWIVMKALEKERTRRYETAIGMARDIERYLRDEPVEACPPSAAYRFKKFVRRNKPTLVTVTIIGVALLFAVGSFGWALRDRAARQSRIAGHVDLILCEVDRLEREQKWPEALASARQAVAAVTSGEADAATARRVDASLKGLELIDRLEAIRMLWATNVEETFGFTDVDRKYAQAFRDHEVDIDELAVEASIQRLKARPGLAIPLAAALDHWVFIRRLVAEKDAASWQRFVAVARGIDPEPLRGRLRSTWERPVSETREELRRLAESIDVGAHRPETLSSLATTLRQAELPDSARRILRAAQSAYPGDYWLNFDLANDFSEERDHEGAVRFLTAAVSIRPYSPAGYYNLSVELRAQGKLDEAVAACRKAIELVPRFYAAHVTLASALRAQGKLDEALAVYRNLIEMYPNNYQAQEFFGGFLHAQGKLDDANAAFGKAIELARKAIELEPKTGARPYLTIGFILDAQGKPDEAIDAYRKAIEADPKALHAYLQLARDQAIDAYRKAIETDPKAAGRFRNNLGSALRERGKLDEAMAVHRQALEVDPKDVNAYNGIALVLQHQGKRDEAIAMFRKAIELDPKHVAAILNLGDQLKDQKKLDEAIGCFRKGIEIEPTFAPAHEYLGNALREQKRLDEAVEAYRKAVQLDPARYPACISLGNALYEQKKLDEAVAAFANAIESNRMAVTAVRKNIAELSKDKDFDTLRSREKFTKFMAALEAKLPVNERAWDLATNADPSQRNPAQAVALAEQALALSPNDANYWNTLGVARYRTGDFEGAIAAFQKYRELRTGDAEWSNPFFLAMAHWRLGNKDEARRWYETAVTWMDKKAPTSPTLTRFRSEAAELLGVKENKQHVSSTAPATAKSPTPKK